LSSVVPARRRPVPRRAGVYVGAGLIAAVLVLGWLSRAGREAAARETRIEAARAALAKAYPNARFARFAGYGRVTPIDTRFSQCGVSTCIINRGDNGTTVAAVVLVGIQPQATAPSVFVSVFDEGGRFLGTGHIVSYVFPCLEPGEWRSVEDLIQMPRKPEPAIVGVAESPAGLTPPE